MKKKRTFWRLLSEYLPSVLTITVAIVAVVLSSLKLIDSSILQSVTVSLLALLGLNQLLVNKVQLEKINDSVVDIKDKIDHIDNIEFDSSEMAILYMIEKLNCASKSVHQASIDKMRTTNQDARRKYESAREKVILSDKIIFRYIGMVDSQRRFRSVKRIMSKKYLHNFYSAFLSNNTDDIPLMSFTVFDRSEVVIRSPYDFGENKKYLSIKNKQNAELFIQYFEKIWSKCNTSQTIEELDKLIELFEEKEVSIQK